MSNYLTRNLKQTAVYWGSPSADGYGGYTFAAPVEISCRWEDRQELFIDAHGDEVKSRAVVYLDQDVDNGGYLFLGTFDDLNSSAGIPGEEDNAQEIKSFKKIPNMKSTFFLRKAWL